MQDQASIGEIGGLFFADSLRFAVFVLLFAAQVSPVAALPPAVALSFAILIAAAALFLVSAVEFADPAAVDSLVVHQY
jgi:hypothetical protein